MGCWPSRQSSVKPEMPTFNVLNVPAFQQTMRSSVITQRSSASEQKAGVNLTDLAELPSSPGRMQVPDTPESDYDLQYQLAALPDCPPLQEQYRPYQSANPMQAQSNAHSQSSLLQQSQHEHPPSLTSGWAQISSNHTPPSFRAGFPPTDTPANHLSSPHTFITPTQNPYHRVEYPPSPHVPNGKTLDQVLAPRGKRRWQSLRVMGRDMTIIRRDRDLADPRLDPKQRHGESFGKGAALATSWRDRRERKRVKALKKRGGAMNSTSE